MLQLTSFPPPRSFTWRTSRRAAMPLTFCVPRNGPRVSSSAKLGRPYNDYLARFYALNCFSELRNESAEIDQASIWQFDNNNADSQLRHVLLVTHSLIYCNEYLERL